MRKQNESSSDLTVTKAQRQLLNEALGNLFSRGSHQDTELGNSRSKGYRVRQGNETYGKRPGLFYSYKYRPPN